MPCGLAVATPRLRQRLFARQAGRQQGQAASHEACHRLAPADPCFLLHGLRVDEAPLTAMWAEQFRVWGSMKKNVPSSTHKAPPCPLACGNYSADYN